MIVFKKGKDVYSKKSGTRMTVEGFTSEGLVVCNFISEEGEYCQAEFEPWELEYAERFRFIPEHLLD